MTEWPYKLAQHAGRYDDLIYCPLDLPLPPTVDVPQFLEWMASVQDPQMLTTKNSYEQAKKLPYPWLSRFLKDAMQLKEAFPELYDYLLLYPFDALTSLMFLAQKGHQDVFTHCDPDGLYCMRLYLTVKNCEGLHFFKARQPFDHFSTYSRNEAGDIVSADWDKYFKTDEPTYAHLPKPTRAYVLNSARAAHAVDRNTCELGERICVLVFGTANVQRRDALIERSLKLYSKNAIWYDKDLS
jgi:hypothetical protein